jgi:hypothetical protein
MKKSRQSPHKPRRKIRNPDLHKQNEIHELFQESEERVRQFLEEFNAERSLSYDQSHQRKR